MKNDKQKKRSSSCYQNKINKITKWYEHIVNNRQEKNQLKLDKKPLRELEYFLEKIKKSTGE